MYLRSCSSKIALKDARSFFGDAHSFNYDFSSELSLKFYVSSEISVRPFRNFVVLSTIQPQIALQIKLVINMTAFECFTQILVIRSTHITLQSIIYAKEIIPFMNLYESLKI